MPFAWSFLRQCTSPCWRRSFVCRRYLNTFSICRHSIGKRASLSLARSRRKKKSADYIIMKWHWSMFGRVSSSFFFENQMAISLWSFAWKNIRNRCGEKISNLSFWRDESCLFLLSPYAAAAAVRHTWCPTVRLIRFCHIPMLKLWNLIYAIENFDVDGNWQSKYVVDEESYP